MAPRLLLSSEWNLEPTAIWLKLVGQDAGASQLLMYVLWDS